MNLHGHGDGDGDGDGGGGGGGDEATNIYPQPPSLLEVEAVADDGDPVRLKAALAAWVNCTPPHGAIENGDDDKRTLALRNVMNKCIRANLLDVVVFIIDGCGCKITTECVLHSVKALREDIIELFLSRGWDIDSPVRGGNDDAMKTSMLGFFLSNPERVQWLLQHGANPNFVTSTTTDGDDSKIRYEHRQNFLVDMAGRRGHIDSLRLLHSYGANLRSSDALHHAAGSIVGNRIPIMAFLLDEVGVPIDRLSSPERGIGACTALYRAVVGRRLDHIEFLLERGADPLVVPVLGADVGADSDVAGKGQSALECAKEAAYDEAVALFESGLQEHVNVQYDRD